MKHTLTDSDASQVNLVSGFSRPAGLTPEQIEANPGAVEGDSVDALALPNGNRLLVLGAVDGFVRGVEVPANEPDDAEDDVQDETPVTA